MNLVRRYKGKRIVIVSHGAATKFALLKWCKLNKNNYKLEYDSKRLMGEELSSPEIFKLEFLENEIQNITLIKY